MRASFLDPQGTLLTRIAPYALVALGWFMLLQWPSLTTNGELIVTAVAFSALNVLTFLPRRRRARDVELSCRPGEITVKHDVRWQRISARSIRGASTAATDRGVMLTLGHAKRAYPIVIEVESEAEAERIRRSLGIGHGGFGAIVWGTIPKGAKKVGAVGFSGLALLGLFSAVWVSHASQIIEDVVTALCIFTYVFFFPMALVGFFRRKMSRASSWRRTVFTIRQWMDGPTCPIRACWASVATMDF